MLFIPDDILRALYVDFDMSTRDKIYLMSTCHTLKNQINITSLLISPSNYVRSYNYFINDYRINNNVLRQQKFQNITSLNIENNKNITDVYYLTLLRDLDVYGSCNINYFNNLTNLTKLNLCFSHRFEGEIDLDISLLSQLTYLDIRFSNIKQHNIKNLINLTTLKLCGNCYINNIKHLTNLTHLETSGKSDNIGQDNIYNLTKLITLNINDNINITDIRTLTNLTCLKIRCYYKVEQNSIDIRTLTNLTCLKIGHYSKIEQNSIDKLTNLSTLDIYNNNNITNINHLTKLTDLDISGSCCIDQTGIMNLHSLTKINYNYNYKITSTAHLTNLR